MVLHSRDARAHECSGGNRVQGSGLDCGAVDSKIPIATIHGEHPKFYRRSRDLAILHRGYHDRLEIQTRLISLRRGYGLRFFLTELTLEWLPKNKATSNHYGSFKFNNLGSLHWHRVVDFCRAHGRR